MAASKDNNFDQSKAYATQEDVYFDDGREIELLHFVYNHKSLPELYGSPQRILKVIDEYARTKKYLMNVGEDKGKLVTDLIAEVKPKTMVELGGYVGYSALLFGDAMRKAGGKRYLSLERNPEFGAVISSLVDLAGLGDLVKVVIGPSADSLQRLHAEGQLKQIDLMFLDHWKPAYTTDLKLCEHLKLVGPGSVLAADNVVKPGNPPYLKYVRSSVEEKRKVFDSAEADADDTEGFPNCTKNQYLKREGHQSLSTAFKGNPNLEYESKMIESWEPSGVPDAVEITRCTREVNA